MSDTDDEWSLRKPKRPYEVVWQGRSLQQIEEAARMRAGGATLKQVGEFLGVGKQRASAILSKYKLAKRKGTPMRGELDV